jgi:membrane associated rhomboid family serine protease
MFYFQSEMLDSWDQPQVRGPFRRFSGSMRNWFGRFSSVVSVILWTNVIVFLFQLVFNAAGLGDKFEHLFALSGSTLRGGFFWQPLTYMFLHDPDDLFHILFNLLLLWFFGREVEYFIGPKNFTRLYLGGGLVGGCLWLAFNWTDPTHLLGASAAVLGCVIAFATLFPDREITLLVFFVLPVTLKAKYLALIAVALDVIPLLRHSGGGVAHLAHLGGAVLGYLYIKQLGYGATPRWLGWLQRLTSALRPRPRPKPRELSREEFMRQEVDPILDKIAREGIHSLTRRERKTLESAKDLLSKQKR